MIHIRNTTDTGLLIDNPELYREVASYLLYCRHELLEYEDEDDVDDHDFNFQILAAEDFPTLDDMLNDLGPPEETVQIDIKADCITQIIYRIIYPTQVLFIPADISDKISF